MARLGLKLFYLRTRERGLSQRQVADAVGVRQATLSHIEQGVSQPNSALLVQLCRFLDVTPTFLLDDERGILPRTAERWQNRDALVTTGDWIELPRDALAETPDGRLLCPIRAGEAFFDDEAATVRRQHTAEDAERKLREHTAAARAAEDTITAELEAELVAHNRRRAGSKRRNAGAD